MDDTANAEQDGTIDLGDVQETLLIPLYFRAVESAKDESLFCDEVARDILPKLNYDFSGFDKAWALRNDVVVRTLIFDELVTEFIARHPNARVINLGAGLDARFWRLDNGQVDWYDLDMPDSIELRRRFLEPGERNHVIAKSMFDTSWFDDVGDEGPTLVVAEALFFYFEEPQIKELFVGLCQRFPGAEMLFQSVCPAIVGKKNTIPVLRRTRAQLKWGIHGVQDIADWSDHLECLEDWSLVDRCEDRWRWYTHAKSLPIIGKFLREVMKINRVRFTSIGRDS